VQNVYTWFSYERNFSNYLNTTKFEIINHMRLTTLRHKSGN